MTIAQVTAILRPTSLKPLDNLLGYWEQPKIKNIRSIAQKQRNPVVSDISLLM